MIPPTKFQKIPLQIPPPKKSKNSPQKNTNKFQKIPTKKKKKKNHPQK